MARLAKLPRSIADGQIGLMQEITKGFGALRITDGNKVGRV